VKGKKELERRLHTARHDPVRHGIHRRFFVMQLTTSEDCYPQV